MRTVFADVTLAILAGGEGSRMGQPKGLLTIAARPILEHLLERLRWDGPTLLVTAPGREHPPGCKCFDRELIDPIAGQGPLRGIVTALESSLGTTPKAMDSTPFIFLPIDMPLMSSEALRWLIEQHDRLGGLGLMIQRPIDNRPRIEPMPLVMRPEALAILRSRLNAGRRSIHGLVSEPGFNVIDAPAEWATDIWTNLNSVDDMKQFINRLDRDEIESNPPTIGPEGVAR